MDSGRILLVRAGTCGGGVLGLLASEEGLGRDDKVAGDGNMNTHTHTHRHKRVRMKPTADLHRRMEFCKQRKVQKWQTEQLIGLRAGLIM